MASPASTPRMATTEFLDWDATDGGGRRWQLRDGAPEPLPSITLRQGRMLSRLCHLLEQHIEQRGSVWNVIALPGVVPRLAGDSNLRVPALAVAQEAACHGRFLEAPLLVIDFLSSANEAFVRQNVWAYASVPSLAECLLLSTARIGGELLRRAPNGDWPGRAALLDAEDELRLDSIGFAMPLRDVYVSSGLG